MAGEELYLVGNLDEVAAANRAIVAAAHTIDQIVESPTASNVNLSIVAVEAVRNALKNTRILARDENAVRNYIAVLEALKTLLAALLERKFEAVCRMIRESQPLVEHWGTTTHIAVFCRRP